MNKCLQIASVLICSILLFEFQCVLGQSKEILKLRLMETTDIHAHIINYDYYKDLYVDTCGLSKVASLIKIARKEAKNTLLFDNGDLIQGNPLGDYIARIALLKDNEVHPVYKAMNLLNYDASTIGNHEFNYGLDFLKICLKGANFPYVNANVYIDDHDNNPDNDKNYFTPYIIINKTFKDEDNKDQALKIGIIGFVAPQIMQWDKGILEGKLIAKDIVDTANKFLPLIKEQGADIVVALTHSGIDNIPRKGKDENAVFYLSKVKGIDAILTGHLHEVFPGKKFDNMEGIDNVKGSVNGVPTVMPGFWGSHLGVIDFTLEKVEGRWKVSDFVSKAWPIYELKDKEIVPLVNSDQEIADAIKTEHEKTIKYIREPIGKITSPIASYFALVKDDPCVQIVNDAQRWYVEKKIAGTKYHDTPVLGASSPSKAGGRGGPNYYIEIKEGPLAIKNASNLYIYPNTLKAVLLNGSQVKEWLEMSSVMFNQIDPKKEGEQNLLNPDFPTYNFDVIDGVTYQIDVTQPARYDKTGKLVNANANRIKNIKYKGIPVTPEQKFIVVTNNYRAYGGGYFPNLDGSNVVIDDASENRQILIDYILEKKNVNPVLDNNWSFTPIGKKTNITFETSPLSQPYARDIKNIKFISDMPNGFAKYSIDLSE